MNLSFLKFSVAMVFCFFFLTGANAQILKLRSTSLATNEIRENGSWKGWTALNDSNLLITIDTEIQRIVIYANETQKFDITDYDGQKIDEDGDDVFTFYCVDNDGRTCRIDVLTLHSQNGKRQLYVYYSDIAFLFNVYLLD